MAAGSASEGGGSMAGEESEGGGAMAAGDTTDIVKVVDDLLGDPPAGAAGQVSRARRLMTTCRVRGSPVAVSATRCTHSPL